MTGPDPRPLPDATARLHAENEALHQQVKLLVQVEQRLYRSQGELSRQLANMRELGTFALSCSGAESPAAIVERAVHVLANAFTLDWIAGVTLDLATGTMRPVRTEPALPNHDAVELSEPEWIWAAGLPTMRIVRLPDTAPGGIAETFAARIWPAEIPPPGSRPGGLLVMTLRAGGTQPMAMLLAWSPEKKRAMYWPADLSPRNQPFLELFANHLERALENAALTESLRERSRELIDSLRELEDTQSRLVQSQKMEAIGQLAGGVAHDFNNILTVILGHAALVRDSIPLDAPRRKDIDRVISAGERAAGITRQLLAFGRRQMQRREAVDLSRLARAMAEMLERLIGEHVHLALDLAPGTTLAWVDPSQVEQVILNLVVNARDAMPDGGEIRLATRAATEADARRCALSRGTDAYVALEVTDTGTGMDEEVRARIFEPFFSTKALGRGTGLGLAVVYGIVEQSEGHVLVESEPGRGTRFTVLLPRTSYVGAGVSLTAAAPGLAGDGAGTVLLVEDEEMIREIAREFLAEAGYVVLEAVDGQAALDRMRLSPRAVDLLLTDVVMPRLGGVRLAEELRKGAPGLPVVFMSGYAREQPTGVTGGGAGAPPSSFLAKPFSREQLLAAVADVLRRARKVAPGGAGLA